jgi:hypothetical protein
MKTVIEMARSVGATAYTNRHYPDRPTHTFNVDQLERLVELVRADEREAIIQEIPGGYSVDPQWVCDMIRARSNTCPNK